MSSFFADPTRIFIAGSSAGAQLAALVALTPNDLALQHGFEDADTSVSGAIALFGYYGWPPNLPLVLSEAAPPLFVIHGDSDVIAPVEVARSFVEKSRAISHNPVLYAELPGAQHNFDLFHSIRTEALIDSIEAFAAIVFG